MSFKSLALALAFAVIGTEAVQIQTEGGKVVCHTYKCCQENDNTYWCAMGVKDW